MTKADPRRSTSLDALSGELVKVIRRHDPEWTGTNDSDPGLTLLEVGAWLAQRLDAYRKASGRPDPYRNFKFRVKWDGVPVTGITRVSALRRTTEIIEHREGGDPGPVRRIPGRVVYEPITLERPLGADTGFEDWMAQPGGTASGSPAPYRKSVRIEVVDPGERVLLAYDVPGCWPSEYRALPDLVERLTLVPDGWQRDKTV